MALQDIIWDESQGELNWDYAIYDVVEVETPQDRIAFGAISNQHIPKCRIKKRRFSSNLLTWQSRDELKRLSNK